MNFVFAVAGEPGVRRMYEGDCATCTASIRIRVRAQEIGDFPSEHVTTCFICGREMTLHPVAPAKGDYLP